MKTLLKNANILNVDDGTIYSSSILVKNNLIGCIEKEIDEQVDVVIDCSNFLIMPSFKNGHTHSAMTFLRGVIDNVRLEEWLFGNIIPREDLLNSDDVYKFSKVAILEYIKNGITFANDMYLFPEAFIKACLELNFPAAISIETGQEIYKKYFEDENFRDKLNNVHPRINVLANAHSVYTVSENDLKLLGMNINNLKMGSYLHLAETKTEVKNCLKEHGLSPVAYANKLGLFKNGGAGYHLVHLEPGDIEVLKSSRVSVISNPGSNLKLGSGIAPLRLYKKEGILVGLGTDGAASNNALSMFYEMRLAFNLENLTDSNLDPLTPLDIIRMATINVSKICHQNNCDGIKVNQYADLIALDLNEPELFPNDKILSHIVNSASSSDINFVMINGNIVYHDHSFVGIDTKKIYQEANDAKLKIEAKLKKSLKLTEIII